MICYRRMTPKDIPAAAAIEATVQEGWSADTIALTLGSDANHCFVAVECAQAGGAAAQVTLQTTQESPRSAQENPPSVQKNPQRLPQDWQSESVCGFCACVLVLDTANLDAVSVAQNHRGRGIGRGLVQHAMRELRAAGAATLWLEARSQNTPALALYASLGFVQNGLRRGFYQNPPDDAVLMTARLDDGR